MISALPSEMIILIIQHARTESKNDLITLRSLFYVSKQVNSIMTSNLTQIIEYYTIRSIDDNNNIYHKFCGRFHSINDFPAIIRPNGPQIWCRNDKCHRDNDLPAAIYNNGTQCWYQNGQYHRDRDLPALIRYDGARFWYQHDELHRDNNLPAVIYADGTQEYYINGKRIFH